MSRFAKYLGIPVIAVALLLVSDTSSAKADGISVQIGGYGVSTYTYRPSLLSAYPVRTTVHYPLYRVGYYGYPYSTPHVHYHRPRLVPHNGHLDYVPGHYRVHP